MSNISVNREARHLWLWGRVAAVALLAVAVLVTCIGLKAVAAPAPEVEKKPEPKKDEPKKEEPKPDEPKKEPAVEQPAFPNFPGAIPPGFDPEAMRKLQQTYAKKMMENMQRMRAG